MKRVIASIDDCSDRTVWEQMPNGYWRCTCCGQQVSEGRLIEPVRFQ